MPIIPNINKDTPRTSGGFWWFAVFGGALAIAFAVRYFVNAGHQTGSALQTAGYAAIGLLGLAAAAIGLLKAFRSKLHEPTRGDQVLKISSDE